MVPGAGRGKWGVFSGYKISVTQGEIVLETWNMNKVHIQLTLNNTGLKCAGSLICRFFKKNACTVHDPQLEVSGNGGLPVGTDLQHFI